MKGVFAVDKPEGREPPIQNPFDEASLEKSQSENIILRTRKGDRSVEIELPGGTADMTDFVVPVSPAFKDSASRSPASNDGMIDERYNSRRSGISDREITGTLSSGAGVDYGARQEIETGLGVMAAEDQTPERDQSYLAALDHIKQLYKHARYEAALLETDELLRAYPTDPKLYEMRGTLFDRIGKPDLALKSWNQALRLSPENQSLRRFIERKQQIRGVASP